jgi:hypothetical protein
MNFPSAKGKNLLGETFHLPNDFAGELNVVLLCFTTQQQLDVNTWLGFLENLKRQHEKLEVYELPTLPRYPGFYQNMIDGWMRQGIPDHQTRATTITLYLNLKEFLRSLELPTINSICTLLVGAKGEVLHNEFGSYNPEKAARFEAAIVKNLEG